MDGDVIPVVHIRLGLFHQLEFLLRVVDERTQFPFVAFTDLISEEFADLSFDVSRGILQNMLKRGKSPVEVGQEMLCSLGKVQDGLQVNDLRACRGDSRKRLG